MNRKKALKITGIVLPAALAAFSIVSLAAVQHLFNQNFARTTRREYSPYLRYEDVADRYERESISFPSGPNRLQGYLYGVGNPEGLVVISHGMGGGGEGYLAETLYFVEHGYQVLAYDNTGCWESEGKNSVGLCQSVLDLDAALSWVESESRFDGVPLFLYGHSWGGYAVTAVLAFDHTVTASASVAGFNDPMTMIIEWGKGMMGPLAYAEYPFIWLNQKLTFGSTFDLRAADAINTTDTPVLIIHGDHDTTVSFNHAGIIAARDRITNPNVQYMICSQAPQNDHNRLFQSLDAISYIKELDEAYQKLDEQYNNEIPDDAKRSFYASIDKFRTSSLDAEFMEGVVEFYKAQKQ